MEVSDDYRRTLDWLMVANETPDLGTVLAQLLNRPAWHELAACRSAGHELFFPERGQSLKPAKGYCDWCAVRDECLAWALNSAEDGTPAERVGVWVAPANASVGACGGGELSRRSHQTGFLACR